MFSGTKLLVSMIFPILALFATMSSSLWRVQPGVEPSFFTRIRVRRKIFEMEPLHREWSALTMESEGLGFGKLYFPKVLTLQWNKSFYSSWWQQVYNSYPSRTGHRNKILPLQCGLPRNSIWPQHVIIHLAIQSVPGKQCLKTLQHLIRFDKIMVQSTDCCQSCIWIWWWWNRTWPQRQPASGQHLLRVPKCQVCSGECHLHPEHYCQHLGRSLLTLSGDLNRHDLRSGWADHWSHYRTVQILHRSWKESWPR